jgi:hypothetical protein
MLGIKSVGAVKTLRIRLMQGIAGHRLDRNGEAYVFSHAPRAVLDWPADEAARFIESGIAQPADGQELSLGMV